MRDIAVPTLLIAGADDVVTPPALCGRQTTFREPPCTCSPERATSNLEAEAEFTRLVIAFLAELA
ncbi:MAG: hypothetical protein IPN77_30830 [Sandaracinaceae bacterium]|nr:hypothetical protein [Sandaracinaceae bacterium]